MGTVVEELDEADHWLSIIQDSDLPKPPQDLIIECRQLRAILATSWATSARNAREKKETREKKERREKKDSSRKPPIQ